MQPRRGFVALSGLVALVFVAADWPQWRGAHRDAKVTGFQTPAKWPEQLKKQWSVTVGDGVATPALVGDQLYVFSRQGGDEILRCLSASDGKVVWEEKYAVRGADGPASGFPGPRCSPAVADGKVVVLGVRGLLSCYDAATGKKLWSKDDFRAVPNFYTSASPVLVDGLCVAQLGGNDGAVVAYDLATGDEKWRESDLPTSYSSPVLMTLGGQKLVVGQVSDGIVAIDVATGKKVWEKFYEGGGSRYKASTPVVDGERLITLDGAASALQLEKQGDKIVDKVLWKNAENRIEYNSPVVKDGLLYGLSQRNEYFCLRVADGKTAWKAPDPSAPPTAGGGGGGGGFGGFGGGGFGRGFGGFGGSGYGNIVAVDSVLFGLTPGGLLVVYEATDKEFKKLASYKVAEGQTYAYPVVSDRRIFIKDRETLTLWTLE